MAVTAVGDMEQLYAGVELGGTKCICILASGPHDIRELVKVHTGEPRETLNEIKKVLTSWQKTNGYEALGVASFGPLDLSEKSPDYGSIITTPKPGWTGVDLKVLAGNVPTTINTDVNAAALAEGLWGMAIGLESWAYITIGTGIGVGSVIGGKLAAGLGHSEAGHLRIPPSKDGFKGSCPYHGDCAEGQASGFAIEARTQLSGPNIPQDHPVWNNVADALAALCHNLIYSTLPQRIIVSGSVALSRPKLISLLREKLNESLGEYASAASLIGKMDEFVTYPTLYENAGPLGAIALAKKLA